MSRHDPLLAALDPLPERIAVAVSGGLDSVALLDALVAAGRHPTILHFDHRWRKEGADDLRFVKELARGHGLPFASGRAPAGTPKTEASARKLRLAFFARALRKLGLCDLVLAHHADDQAETLLLQLLRGGGGHGIAPLSLHGKATFHRPWLGIARKEIAAYAAVRKLSWRDDPSNLDPRLLRNRVRLQLLPLLEAGYDPAARRHLARAAEIRRGDREWLDFLVAADSALPRLPVKRLRDFPVGHQRHLLRAWLQRQGVTDLSFDDIEAARRLLLDLRPARINLAKGRHLRRRAGFLELVG